MTLWSHWKRLKAVKLCLKSSFLLAGSKRFIRLGSLCLLCGCGYRFVALPESARALAIPFVRGDRTGTFTAALSYAALQEGFELDRRSPLVLDVEIGLPESVDIGRLYERSNSGTLTRIAVPNEGRLTILARVRLRDRSGKVLAGPFDITESIAYDFQSDLSQTTAFVSEGRVNSLLRYGRGQLDFFGAAQDAACRRLEIKLSQRMMEVIRSASGCLLEADHGLHHPPDADTQHPGKNS